MTTRLVPASGANYVEAGTVVSRQLYPRIMGMRMGLLSAEQVELLAPKLICDNTVYAKNLPKLSGPNDPALGPSDRRVRCSTCYNTWFGCPGHHGVIRLPIPVYHVGFIDFIYKILQAFCWNCSSPLCDPEDPRLKSSHASACRGIVLFTMVFMMGRGRYKCRTCNMFQPKYKKAGMVISRTFADRQLEAIGDASSQLLESALRRFTPADALEILRNIKDEHCRMMGVDPERAHPSSMILQNLAVLPPNARPAIMASEGSKRRGQDDITSQTQDILKVCRALRKAILKAQEPQLFVKKKNNKAKAAKAAAKRAEENDSVVTVDAAENDNLTSMLNTRISVSEFLAPTEFLGDLQEADVNAIRFATPKAVLSASTFQSAVIWDMFPLLCEKVQNSVTILYDNSGKYAPQARQRTGGAKKSLMDRIVGKQGRIRGNLVAKRVDMSARTVIIPDASLDVDELGIPAAFAIVLTLQEDVNTGNMDRLQGAVRLGHGVLGGASRILHASGEMTQLQYVDAHGRECIRLQVGDTVERHLLDGDRVVFNRQPSLHKLSVMFHRVKLIDGLAIAVPLAVVEPYNADFDGDEMNLHVLQSMLANAEGVELMAVSKNVMNPQNNQPCLSLVQDARVGGMLLTSKHTRLDRDRMHQCMGAIRYPVPGKDRMPDPAGILPSGEPFWTGKQLVSLIMPSIFIEKRVRGAEPDVGPDDPRERYVLIEDGVLLHGTLCKGTLGTCTGGITHRICTAFGQEAAVRFLSDFQRIIYAWMPTRGLTMGLGDCIIPKAVQDEIDRTTGELDTLVAELTREAHDLQEHMTATETARVEAGILTILTSNLDYASRLVMADMESEDAMSGFMAMVLSGSKGNTNNIAQVKAHLGQQVVDGNRISPSNVSRRTLPMFPKGAFSAAARGFIANSYLTGMQPHEFFNHMQAGREGLVATAVKTAETGYKYRSMAKGQETNVVQWDGTVRNAQNYIIEFVAGGDGMDPTRVERVHLPVLALSDAVIEGEMAGGEFQRVLHLRDVLRAALMTLLYRDFATKILLPVNIPDEIIRIKFQLNKTKTRFAEDTAPSTDEQYCEVTRDLINDLVSYFPSREATVSLEIAILWFCRPRVLQAAGINARTYRHMLATEIKQRTIEALVQPGESVGIIAAQSIGEPSTQFTLDAFHQAGQMQRRLSLGVPRLRELLHASERIATPSMVVPLRGKVTKEEANRLGRTLQFLCVDYVLHSSYVQHDPPGDGMVSPLTTMYKDSEMMEHAAALYGSEFSMASSRIVLSPWIIRLVLNKSVLTEHGKTPEDVAKEVAKQLSDCKFIIVYSQANMSHWVLRIRLTDDSSERACRLFHARVRNSVLLGGIDGIRDARAIDMKKSIVQPGGAVAQVSEVVIDTGGSALMRMATRDWADWENTATNDVQEVAQTLGMAAARALLFAELDRVISYDGGYVDPRHLKALVSTMTHRGYIMAMTRHGINRVDYSVFQRASYEEPVDMIQQAALTSEVDNLDGMCQAILAGQKVPIGTGTVTIQQDVESGGRTGLTQFGRVRNSLASREHVAMQVTGSRKRRMRENLVRGRGSGKSMATTEAYVTPPDAAAAWGGDAPKPSDRATSRPAVARLRIKLSGVMVSTSPSGVSMSAGCALTCPVVAPEPPIPEVYRPSSPSDLFFASSRVTGDETQAKRARVRK